MFPKRKYVRSYMYISSELQKKKRIYLELVKFIVNYNWVKMAAGSESVITSVTHPPMHRSVSRYEWQWRQRFHETLIANKTTKSSFTLTSAIEAWEATYQRRFARKNRHTGLDNVAIGTGTPRKRFRWEKGCGTSIHHCKRSWHNQPFNVCILRKNWQKKFKLILRSTLAPSTAPAHLWQRPLISDNARSPLTRLAHLSQRPLTSHNVRSPLTTRTHH